MTFFSTMKKGQAIKEGEWNKPKKHLDPNLKAIAPPLPKTQFQSVSSTQIKAEVAKASLRATLLYAWNANCAECAEDLRVLEKMKTYYEPYQIGVATLNLDSPAMESYIANYFTHHGLSPKLTLYQKQDQQPNFFIDLHPSYNGTVPAFFVFNRQGKIVDMWTGKMPIKDVDARFRESMKR